MDWKLLRQELENLKQPSYREKQIRQAFFCDFIGGWEEVSVLPKDLRSKLAEKIEWFDIKPDKIQEDKKDGSVKASFFISTGEKIESVLIKHSDGRNTVCVSAQAGCPVGCAFCATGGGGFKKNLLKEEIVEQVIFFSVLLKEKGEKVSNVVFMGMGEPFLNYENVLGAVRILNDKEYFNLGARHISISTIGIVPGIEQLTKEGLQVNLAFSLHAPNDRKRERLVPINRKYNLESVFKAIDAYIERTKRRVMIEYLMIDGVNDGPQDALELSALMRGRPLCYVNLIPYNETGKFRPSPRKKIKEFAKILEDKGIRHTVRREFGGSIDAACGQLAGR